MLHNVTNIVIFYLLFIIILYLFYLRSASDKNLSFRSFSLIFNLEVVYMLAVFEEYVKKEILLLDLLKRKGEKLKFIVIICTLNCFKFILKLNFVTYNLAI